MCKGAGQNEWYFDYNHIMDIMYSLYIELVGTIEIAKKWEVYFLMLTENSIY